MKPLSRWAYDHRVELRRLDPRTWMLVLRQRRGTPLGARHWERNYGKGPDPFGFEVADRAHVHHERIVAALAGRRYGRAFEAGCGEGALSQLLAPLCDELLAVDISQVAIDRARTRLADEPGVRFERGELPADLPAGPFDLMVLSDVMCYWTRRQVADSVATIEAALAPGGVVLVTHWRPNYPTHLLSGDAVQRIFRKRTSLERTFHDAGAQFRYERYAKPA